MKDNDKFIQEFEMALLWESGSDRETLSKKTGIGIRTIQKFINDYIQSANDTVSYSKKLKAYIANEAFIPRLINDDPESYLQYCLGERLQQSLLQKEQSMTSPRFPIEDIQSLTTSNVDDRIMDTLVQAINTQSQICGTYVAKKGTRSDIILSPHSIALARNRYHARAYYHKYDRYSDFVVGRFESIRIYSLPQQGVNADNDTEWQTFDDLVFELNPELTHEEIDSFRMEWNLPAQSNQKIIRTRRALAKYVRQEMEKTAIGTAHQTWIYKEDK
ncbi:WYL domain-containing protein [Photobacterium leiognathi]|uniref:WYL domain-containing protein n=1 Tax=Photobacterium leiognathi TaxID=553611 RepID=UPI0029814CE9|nr:WYL domain-containing protein [Photobacterium leiognathi]